MGKGKEMKKDIWQELEEPRFTHIAALFEWAMNYNFGDSPWALFLDVTGWSSEHIDGRLVPDATLDSIARPLFAKALTELDAVGEKAWHYIDELEALALDAF